MVELPRTFLPSFGGLVEIGNEVHGPKWYVPEERIPRKETDQRRNFDSFIETGGRRRAIHFKEEKIPLRCKDDRIMTTSCPTKQIQFKGGTALPLWTKLEGEPPPPPPCSVSASTARHSRSFWGDDGRGSGGGGGDWPPSNRPAGPHILHDRLLHRFGTVACGNRARVLPDLTISAPYWNPCWGSVNFDSCWVLCLIETGEFW